MKILKILSFILMLTIGTQAVRASILADSPVDKILNAYLDIKNALASDDANAAKAKAKDLVAALSANTSGLSADQQKTFAKFHDKLLFDSRHISETAKIEHQREHFTSLSNNMYEALKGLKMNTATIYEQYCPMKKAYWLSDSKQIKNPYYGSSMLTCGKVAETLAPAK